MNNHFNIMVPFRFYFDKQEEMFAALIKMKRQSGIRRFLLLFPDKKIRISGFPDNKIFVEFALALKAIITELKKHDIEVGWWCLSSFKTGKATFQNITGVDGAVSEISSCPLDTDFKKAFCDNISTVAEIAKPYMIMIEDDFELSNHPGVKFGCFCPLHLASFAEKTGHAYSRHELHDLFGGTGNENLELRKQWGEVCRDSIVQFANSIRKAVDKVTPDTRIALCQPGCCEKDGDITESVVKALAGENTRPAVRLYGTSYSSNDSGHDIPLELFNSMFYAQKLPENVELYHETDTYPHTRFFTSAARVESQLYAVNAYGVNGSFLHLTQNLDDSLEDDGYLNMFSENIDKLNYLAEAYQKCELKGCQIVYRPNGSSAWAHLAGRYGIPVTTKNSKVKLLSGATVNFISDPELIDLLKGRLFIDAEAASIISKRGFGNLIGVDTEKTEKVDFYIEQICNIPLFKEIKGRKIYNYTFAAAGCELSKFYKLKAHSGTEILTEYLSPDGLPVQPGLTRFENELGGKIAVLATCLDGNNSSSIFCYRKRRIINEILKWLNNDELLPVTVAQAPNVFITFNQQIKREWSILTIVNLCADKLPEIKMQFNSFWKNSEILELKNSKQWQTTATKWDRNYCILPGDFDLMRTRIFKFISNSTNNQT